MLMGNTAEKILDRQDHERQGIRMETFLGKHWQHLRESEVLDLLETDLDRGLDLFAVENRQARFGPNAITQRTGQGPLVRFLLQFHQPLVYILLAAAVITALLQEWVDSGVIFAVVLMNAAIGFVQESKALKAIDALAKAMTSDATVLRSGEKKANFSDRACSRRRCVPAIGRKGSRRYATPSLS